MTDNSQVKVIVGMSGGVDSSVSAYLLQQQGYQVEGLFMKNWEEDDTDEYCAAAQDLKDAQSVCDKLGIPYILLISQQNTGIMFLSIFLPNTKPVVRQIQILCATKKLNLKHF